MPLTLLRIASKVYTTLAVGKLNRKECADPYNLLRLCLRSVKFLNLEQAEISNPKLVLLNKKQIKADNVADKVFLLAVIISFRYNYSFYLLLKGLIF